MGVLTRAEKTRRRAREVDRISCLPDDVLVDIVSLLPTIDGARTQILSSRWRHLWRSAPLNLNLGHIARVSLVSRILSAHPGPVRRFVVPCGHNDYCVPSRVTLDRWLRSPALDNLQELRFQYYPRLRPPPSVGRFSSTLRVASFHDCTFPDRNNGGVLLLLPVLESLTLSDVSISERSFQALLASCPVLQSLMLYDNYGFSRLQVLSPSLRSISVGNYWRRPMSRLELVIEKAPCLEKLHCPEKTNIIILVIFAPRLAVLGELCDYTPRLQFGITVLQGSNVYSMADAVTSLKVLSLSGVKLCLHMAIDLLKYFPQLEKLYIKVTPCTVDVHICYSLHPKLGQVFVWKMLGIKQIWNVLAALTSV